MSHNIVCLLMDYVGNNVLLYHEAFGWGFGTPNSQDKAPLMIGMTQGTAHRATMIQIWADNAR